MGSSDSGAVGQGYSHPVTGTGGPTFKLTQVDLSPQLLTVSDLKESTQEKSHSLYITQSHK